MVNDERVRRYVGKYYTLGFLFSFVLEERNRLFCHVAKLSSVEYAKSDYVHNHYWIVTEIREMIYVHFKGKKRKNLPLCF